jgi:uncharacterized cupin superfamily protein
MSSSARPKPVHAREVAPRAAVSFYPEPFKSRVAGRRKRQLGEHFGLKNFGVNLTTLAPGAQSSVRHAHTRQDEFIYVVQGRPTLCTDDGKTELSPGMCMGFKAGGGNAHHLRNETAEEVLYLEIGDRTPGDEVHYPDDDLHVVDRKYLHKDGTPY